MRRRTQIARDVPASANPRGIRFEESRRFSMKVKPTTDAALLTDILAEAQACANEVIE